MDDIVRGRSGRTVSGAAARSVTGRLGTTSSTACATSPSAATPPGAAGVVGASSNNSRVGPVGAGPLPVSKSLSTNASLASLPLVNRVSASSNDLLAFLSANLAAASCSSTVSRNHSISLRITSSWGVPAGDISNRLRASGISFSIFFMSSWATRSLSSRIATLARGPLAIASASASLAACWARARVVSTGGIAASVASITAWAGTSSGITLPTALLTPLPAPLPTPVPTSLPMSDATLRALGAFIPSLIRVPPMPIPGARINGSKIISMANRNQGGMSACWYDSKTESKKPTPSALNASLRLSKSVPIPGVASSTTIVVTRADADSLSCSNRPGGYSNTSTNCGMLA